MALDDFNSLTYGERCFLSGGLVEEINFKNSRRAKPYYLAFHHCLAHAAKLARPGKKVQFVFAQQDEFRPQALSLFLAVKERLPPEARSKIGGCDFEDIEDIGPPLEVADLLAHCWFAHMQYGQHNSPDRERALNYLMAMTGSLHRYGAKDFEMLMRHVTREQRAAMRVLTS